MSNNYNIHFQVEYINGGTSHAARTLALFCEHYYVFAVYIILNRYIGKNQEVPINIL